MLAEGWIFNNMPSLADREGILMRETCLGSSLICEPQHRNILFICSLCLWEVYFFVLFLVCSFLVNKNNLGVVGSCVWLA
ncbi:hypothetical protein CerSpe_288280 [Prunus speciosa]